MAKIELRKVAHSYAPGLVPKNYALSECDITWENGGRYAVLGPSGCGKTTMLNIMSGLVTPSQGKIFFDGIDVTNLGTSDRNIAQVFQFPVIYNTMTVAQNLAFPLVCRYYPKDEIDKKVKQVASALELETFLGKRATSLTADQKQLISLGRGLVREDVSAILMDEPLTVIDPDLKFKLRRRLKELNQLYNSTLIYVTHDQNEAMTFADKIIVMNHGEIVQIGTPLELFEKPATTHVAHFIGSPAMNLFDVNIASNSSVKIGADSFAVENNLSYIRTDNLQLGFRSEFVDLASPGDKNSFEIEVSRVEDFGNYQLISGYLSNTIIKAKVHRDISIPSGKMLMKIDQENCCVYADGRLVEN